MKTKKIFKNGTLLILALFITSLMWSNGLDTKGNESDKNTNTVANVESDIYQVTYGVIDQSAEVILIKDAARSSDDDIIFNFPDPFTNATSIVYELKKDTHVTLWVLKANDLKVILVDKYLEVGTYSVIFEPPKNAPSGYYTAILVTNFGTYFELMRKKGGISTSAPNPGSL